MHDSESLQFKLYTENTMKQNFLIASVVGMATASIDWYKDPYNELDVTIDGQTQSLYLADTYWTKIKDYNVAPP